METINVRGLPEPVVRALESMVETLRRQMTTDPAGKPGVKKTNGQIPRWPGKVIGALTREEIYDDAA